jgi:hypothetical protein
MNVTLGGVNHERQFSAVRLISRSSVELKALGESVSAAMRSSRSTGSSPGFARRIVKVAVTFAL